jgi:glutamate 5-kinase
LLGSEHDTELIHRNNMVFPRSGPDQD